MRDIANEARNRDYKVEYYHCASDPESLDGITIRDTSVGVLDGTAPHVGVSFQFSLNNFRSAENLKFTRLKYRFALFVYE